MAGRNRGKEVAFQTEIENQEEWEEQLGKEGLLIVDVYQDWCGPCKPMLPVFKRINNELGDDLLRFAIAKADTIDALDRYRGKCEPKFLFYAGGVLVEVVNGADSPAMSKAIEDQLAAEHNVLETGGTRVEYVDTKYPPLKKTMVRESSYDVSESESEMDQNSTDEEEEENKRRAIDFNGEEVNIDGLPDVAQEDNDILIEKEAVVLVAAPMIFKENTLEEIRKKLKSSNFDTTYEQEIEVDEQTLAELVPAYQLEGILEMGMEVETPKPAQIFVVTKGEMGKNVHQDIKEHIGPENYSLAVEFSPGSLRAIVGHKDAPLCGLVVAESITESKRMLKELLPNYVAPKISLTNFRPVRENTTVAYVRPPLWETQPANLFSSITELGFKIILKKEVTLEKEQVNNIYKHSASEEYYQELVHTMLRGPTLVMLIGNNTATVVTDFKNALGPHDPTGNLNCLRGKFQMVDEPLNQLDSSPNNKSAEKEKQMFFPMEQVLILIKPNVVEFKDQIISSIKDESFIIAAKKEVTLTEEQMNKLYESYKKLSIYSNIVQSLSQAPCCFLIVSKVAGLERLKTFLGYKTVLADLPSEEEEEEEEDQEEREYFPSSTAPSAEMSNVESLSLQGANTPSYYPDQFESLSQLFGLPMPDNALHIPDTIEECNNHIKEIFGEIQFHRDGFVKKTKKAPKHNVCEIKAPQVSSLEEVYEEIDKMPKPVEVAEEPEEDEYEKQRLQYLQEEALIKEREKEEAREIHEADYLDEDTKWGTLFEYPANEEENVLDCCEEKHKRDSKETFFSKNESQMSRKTTSKKNFKLSGQKFLKRVESPKKSH